MRNRLIIVGRGQFADEFINKTASIANSSGLDIKVETWGSTPPDDAQECILLHVGSGRQLGDALAFCQEQGVPLVQASTGVDLEIPASPAFALVEAPNLSLPLVKLFKLLGAHPKIFRELDISIVESHQSEKTSLPGTAVKFAELLGGDADAIESLRDKARQRDEYEIPEAFLGAHALHDIKITGLGAEISLGTRILGRETYVQGLVALWPAINELAAGHYFVADLV